MQAPTEATGPDAALPPAGFQAVLLASVFVIATCGLVYELIAGALASYLLGDSVTQFSTVIGTYLFAMGIGSYLSRFVRGNLVWVFIQVELLVGFVGGSSAAALFLLFNYAAGFQVLLYALVLLTGMLVGLEIPLLMRILRHRYAFSELVSQVFTFDYIGALLASLLFPLVLVPYLGLVRSAYLFGLFNVAVAAWALWLFRGQLRGGVWLALQTVLLGAYLAAGVALGDYLLDLAERDAYPDAVVYAKSTPYQRMVLTQGRDLRLYLNGNLQFASADEYRYHEALVHPALAASRNGAPREVLVLGGGDGLAVREILRYPSVRKVVLVDLDPAMTQLFASHPSLLALNDSALRDPRVQVVNADAFQWLRKHTGTYDAVVVDFPDPNNFSLGKLYTDALYRELRRVLRPHAWAVVQSTSPWVARQAFWCVARTLQAVGLQVTPYHVYVPAFGDWGFLLAGHAAYQAPAGYPPGLRYLTPAAFAAAQQFPPDMGPLPVAVNRLNNQALVRYFEAEWGAVE